MFDRYWKRTGIVTSQVDYDTGKYALRREGYSWVLLSRRENIKSPEFMNSSKGQGA